MLDLFGAIIEALTLWGFLIGLLISATIVFVISQLTGVAFSFPLFVILCFPLCALGVYLQYQIEVKKIDNQVK